MHSEISDPGKAWYLIHAKPREERRAYHNLERQGYETYLPVVRNRRRRRGQYVASVEPMFPRYLFVHLDCLRDNWAPIRSTFGVSALVRFGDMPARVPESLVTALKESEDAEGVQNLPVPEFERGQRVRILHGAMAGYEAVFWAKSGSERVTVLLTIAGNEARINVPATEIESAS